MTATALVSCIMPTRNRRSFAGQAIWYFLRQDYSNKELIVVDDGEDAIVDLIPDDRRIQYIQLQSRLTLGEKRNLACEAARGSLIAHWDDDDWMAPHRLSLQVAELHGSGADVCGTRELLHYRPKAGDAWLYSGHCNGRPWLAGGTLVYQRSTWLEHPFPNTDVGEDSAFVDRLAPGQLHAQRDTSFYIALIHPGNTASKNLNDQRWQRRPLDEVSQLLGFDRDFYVALRNGDSSDRVHRSASTASTITVAASFMVYDGYGSMAEYLALGMSRAGASINVVPLDLDLEGMSADFCQLVERSHPDPRAPVLYFSWPRPDLERFRLADDLVINTMWESSRLPADWPERLNRARAVIVPTRFVARICRESGVTVPIEVIPEGVDPEVYHYEERPDRADLTTLMVGPVVDRKHSLEGISAWKMAFEGDSDARLIIKSRFRYGNYVSDDPRIRLIEGNETTRGIAHWYRKADILLALGNEGFGLPLVEAMATGLPAIALNSEGQGDVCEQAEDCLLPVAPRRWEEYKPESFGRCGVSGVPNVDEVAAQLRWVRNHRDEAREMGRAASEWAIKNRNVWTKGPAVLEVMERRIQPPRPLRRFHTLLVPSWRSTCGLAEYTRQLAEATGHARVVDRNPDLQRVRLLHVQHERSLFRDDELTRQTQEAHQRRIPVVITEHAVNGESHPWERDADALVALTEEGSRRLQTRWPGKKVEYIPPGCPASCSTQKKSRGRVIGAFGFLERHKGFWELLDVLGALPQTELLLFSHARSRAREREWTEDAQGKPVRRVGRFLPLDGIIRRLAAETDVLVFWYKDVSHASASAAIRVGLSTGVPVLASPTSWFQDVRHVTYQPKNLTEGVQRLLEDTPLRKSLSAAAREYCHEHRWSRVAEGHRALWNSLET